MSLLGLLVLVVIIGVVLWAARALIAAFAIPNPFATLIYVVIVIIALVWFVQAITGGGLGLSPGVRVR